MQPSGRGFPASVVECPQGLGRGEHASMERTVALSRRTALLGTAGAVVAITMSPKPASASLQPATEAAIKKLIGDRKLNEGRVTLRLPPIAENGNTIPLTVVVESPMSAADHVKAVHVFADRNPTPDVASFHLTPAMGRAEVSTRIRLGQTQDVVAVAEMSDGSVFVGRQEVKVTIGGCGG
ncbi:MAG: thiosulfate oxidation carrier protein SoxY [Acetobacteraceae bacterium]|nr:thiosulfate oxidation carrier protein SoxY [Acetobacteraceae bacterium]